MGRGRGKGKKLTVVHDDPGSGGEEVLPTIRRRGRPHKTLKIEIEDDAAEKIEEEEGGDVKLISPSKEPRGSTTENGKKRKRPSQVKENSDTALEETGAALKSNNENSSRINGFRHNGSRRKSKPRRAAEAGVECK